MCFLLRKVIILIINVNPAGDMNMNNGIRIVLFVWVLDLLTYNELFSHNVFERLLHFSILHSYGLVSSDCFDYPEVSNDLLLELH